MADGSRGKAFKVVVCLTNHERPDCAKINMEIVKLNYRGSWPVIHACSGSSYEPHIEDVLIRCEQLPFIAGALNLRNQAHRAAVNEYNPDYIVHLEADTWVFDQGLIEKYIRLLEQRKNACVAASSWSTDQRPGWRRSGRLLDKLKIAVAKPLNALGVKYGIRRKNTLSTQFFIVKNDVRVQRALDKVELVEGHTLERDLYRSMVKEFGRRGIIGMTEREPVHPDNRHWCPQMSLHSQHWPEQLARPANLDTSRRVEGVSGQYDIPGKKEVLAKGGFNHLGPAMKKLLESTNTDYYNPRAKRY